MTIITVWIKDLQIKVAFESGHVMIRRCKSQQELDTAWQTVQELCKHLGKEIELK